MMAAVVAYFLATFIAYAPPDALTWRWALHEVKQQLAKQEHDDAMQLLAMDLIRWTWPASRSAGRPKSLSIRYVLGKFPSTTITKGDVVAAEPIAKDSTIAMTVASSVTGFGFNRGRS